MASPYPNLPRAMTSFGAAIVHGAPPAGSDAKAALYVYGGHHGSTHHYADDGQSGDLLRLSLASGEPPAWETLSSGPRLQGLALLAHGDALIRLGGFEARNRRDEEQNLWSLAEVAQYDLRTGVWTELPALPEGRSSFDAVLVGDTIHVVGGWSLRGNAPPVWPDSHVALDLSEPAPRWRELSRTGFQRRALAVGTLGGRIYAIGGMQSDGNVSSATSVFDIAAGRWSVGPDLPGEPMEAFGAACCTAEGRLYVSTSAGSILRLAPNGDRWERVATLPQGRFFHRMIAHRPGKLLLLGGAAMMRGKFAAVEEVSIP